MLDEQNYNLSRKLKPQQQAHDIEVSVMYAKIARFMAQ